MFPAVTLWQCWTSVTDFHGRWEANITPSSRGPVTAQLCSASRRVEGSAGGGGVCAAFADCQACPVHLSLPSFPFQASQGLEGTEPWESLKFTAVTGACHLSHPTPPHPRP
jgi:hypothetical protein